METYPARMDQYGNPVPADLVTLPDIMDCAAEEYRQVVAAAWYEVNGVLLASAAALPDFCEDAPLDSGIDLTDMRLDINYIQDILKRAGAHGFYHA